MIKKYSYEELGKGHFGWLSARYHFSFSNYHNPDRNGFGNLLVINDDTISAHSGFNTHPHQNMEIITYVKQGAITHRDSLNNHGITKAGDIQVMSAGSGIRHSEHNEEDIETKLFQIWIIPDQQNVTPRWETKQFPKQAGEKFSPLASGYKEDIEQGALFIYQRAAIWGARFNAGTSVKHLLRTQSYILISHGKIDLNGTFLKSGDGAEITDISEITINNLENSEILIIEV